MGIGSTAKKIKALRTTVDQIKTLSTDLRDKVTELRDEVVEIRASLNTVDEELDEQRAELAEQRALLEAIADQQGIDVAAVVADAREQDATDTADGSDGEGATDAPASGSVGVVDDDGDAVTAGPFSDERSLAEDGTVDWGQDEADSGFAFDGKR